MSYRYIIIGKKRLKEKEKLILILSKALADSEHNIAKYSVNALVFFNEDLVRQSFDDEGNLKAIQMREEDIRKIKMPLGWEIKIEEYNHCDGARMHFYHDGDGIRSGCRLKSYGEIDLEWI